MPLFALLGGIIGGALIESIGRRKTILLTALPFIICEYILLCNIRNKNYAVLLVARIWRWNSRYGARKSQRYGGKETENGIKTRN